MPTTTNNDAASGKVLGPIPLLPLRDIIVFPHMVSQLFVGRERSIAALDEAMARGKEVFLAAQRNAKTNEPAPDDVFLVGAVGVVMQLLRLPDGTVRVQVEGKRRAKVLRYVSTEPFFLVEYEELPETCSSNVEVVALMRSVQNGFEILVKLNKKIPPETLMTIQAIDDPARLSDQVIAHLPTIQARRSPRPARDADARQRLERLIELMQAEIEILQVEKKIRSRVKKQMERTQKVTT
jgi:ATP-dependent Lon protease